MKKALRVLASLALLGWLAWRTPWHQVAEAFGRLDLRWWLAAVLLYALTQVVSSARWMWLSRPLGFHQPLPRFFTYYAIGMFFNLVLPTSVGGDVVRAWYLDDRSGRRLLAGLSVLVDRGTGLLVLLVLGCAAVLACPVPLAGWVICTCFGMAGGAGALILTLLAFGDRFSRPRLNGTTGWRNRVLRLAGKLADLRHVYLPRPGLVTLATALSLVVQLANVVLVWLIARGLALEVPAAYYGVLVPVVTLLTLLPVSLNGMGVREGATVLLLRPLGVDAGTALTLAFLWFATFSVVSLAGAGFYVLGRGPRFEGQDHDESVRGDSDQGRTGELEAAA